jgi:hypothetical protein
VSRLWSRVSVRATSVALLLTGVVGGLYLGQDRQVQQRTAQVDLVNQADQAELDLLKERHAEHAAARAPQRKAQAEAAGKAAAEAKAAADKAHQLEEAVVKQQEKDKKTADDKAKADKAKAKSGSGEGKPYTGPIPSSCNEYSGNRAIGCAILLDSGFGLDQMGCLDKLFTRESGWNPKARNASSGAYGIAQALPGSKMASIADDWETSVETQVKWGLSYIRGRYDTPCKAWAHSQSTGWY